MLRIDRAGFSLDLWPGQTLALTGASGAGKSTLLMQVAGLLPSEGVLLNGRAVGAWDEASLRKRVTLLPQRSALMAGTVREALSLAGDHPDDALWAVLRAACLDAEIAARGGLDARLGEGGAGLSGGQARRLTLARCLLRAPDLMLLDEPTEGLDEATATAVLAGVRRHLPEAALLVALHRGAEHAIIDRVVTLRTGV